MITFIVNYFYKLHMFQVMLSSTCPYIINIQHYSCLVKKWLILVRVLTHSYKQNRDWLFEHTFDFISDQYHPLIQTELRYR